MFVLLQCLCDGSAKELSTLGPVVEATSGLSACLSAALHRAIKLAWAGLVRCPCELGGHSSGMSLTVGCLMVPVHWRDDRVGLHYVNGISGSP